MDNIFAIVKLQCHMLTRKTLRGNGMVPRLVRPFLATSTNYFLGLINAVCFCTIWLSANISSMVQKEFWLQVIQLHRRADLILYLLVDLQHFRVFLRLMVLLRCLPDPLLMGLLLLQFLPSVLRPLKLLHSSLCPFLDNLRGISNSQVKHCYHPQCHLHLKSSSSGHLTLVCSRCHHLHKLLPGLFHHHQ